MFNGAERLAVLAAVLALAAIGVALALTSVGVPFALAALVAAAAAGFVQYAAIRSQPPPDRSAEAVLQQRLDEYRAATAALRHDLRGVLSPALMMSDRLINHQESGVQRAGQAVMRSVERATALLANHRETLAAEAPNPSPADHPTRT